MITAYCPCGAGDITAGPDGALWFTDVVLNKIGRITTAGTVTEYLIPTPLSISGFPSGVITAGPDGALWFTEAGANKIGRITTAGAITEYPIPNPGSSPQGIVAGPDGALWFTDHANKIGRITTAGAITEYSIPASMPASVPIGIATGPDGALWFTEGDGAAKIGRITTAGTITEYPIPSPASGPRGIAAGPDGALWFAENGGNKIGRITTAGTITEYPIPSPASSPLAIAAGSDGALWFAESTGHNIGRITSGNTNSLVAAVLPSSRSVQVGNTATAFATIINAGATAASGCAIVPVTAGFVYQTTNPSTNALTGSPNTPVAIPAGGTESFVIAFTPNAPFVPATVMLGFACTGVNAAPSNSGLNTLLLSASATPVPDIVALAATAQNDGILHITGTSGSNAFAVATVNVGASAVITATANTGAATLPLVISLCQTNPSTGACLAAPAASISTTIGANATPTFGIFATASGGVSFLPAANRIFVQFSDANGIVRGSTSVAVQTQ